MWLEYIGAFLTGVGSVLGAALAIRAVVRHEKAACDSRLDAFKEGLTYGEQKSNHPDD